MTKADRRGQFNVTGIDPRLIIQAAFTGSRPQGLGFLHHQPGGLSEDEMAAVSKPGHDGSIHIDYLRGRSMKFHLRRDRDSGEMFFDLDWYDHGRRASEQLMRDICLPDVEAAIEAARAGKKAKEDEWLAQELEAARSAVGFIAAGQTSRPDGYCNFEEKDPRYTAWAYGTDRAIREGWVAQSEDYRTYSLTPAGAALLPSPAPEDKP